MQMNQCLKGLQHINSGTRPGNGEPTQTCMPEYEKQKNINIQKNQVQFSC